MSSFLVFRVEKKIDRGENSRAPTGRLSWMSIKLLHGRLQDQSSCQTNTHGLKSQATSRMTSNFEIRTENSNLRASFELRSRDSEFPVDISLIYRTK